MTSIDVRCIFAVYMYIQYTRTAYIQLLDNIEYRKENVKVSSMYWIRYCNSVPVIGWLDKLLYNYNNILMHHKAHKLYASLIQRIQY